MTSPEHHRARPCTARWRARGGVLIALLALCIAHVFGCASAPTGTPYDPTISPEGPHRYGSKRNLLTNHMARNSDGTINVVVEIPAGTSEKWEVSETGDAIVRDFTGEKPRTIDYLAYPGNYGMIPRTLLSAEQGGDGGALDVMVLGPAVPRGTTVRAQPIGIIRVVDRMEQDDKVLAVMRNSTLSGVEDLESLRRRYPGVSEILTLWWSNAHGKRAKVDLMGTGSRGQANAVIDYASENFKKNEIAKEAAAAAEAAN